MATTNEEAFRTCEHCGAPMMIRTLYDEARVEIDRQKARYRALAALVSRMIRYAREDEMQTPGSTRLARALAEAERVIAPDVGALR